jgi:hypothetical protein
LAPLRAILFSDQTVPESARWLLESKTEPREVIAIRHMWAGYGSEEVLEDVNLSVYEGDFVGLIGPNGGGKTTLLRVLLGLLPPMRGEVRVLGRPVKEGRRAIGYVPQVIAFDRDFPINVWDVARMGRLGHRGLPRRCARWGCSICATGPSARSPAGSASAPTSPARWRRSPRSCCWTSRRPASILG